MLGIAASFVARRNLHDFGVPLSRFHRTSVSLSKEPLHEKLTIATLLLAATAFGQPVFADNQNDASANKVTIAVFGDWPYSQNLLNNANLLINSVNLDPDVTSFCMSEIFILEANPAPAPEFSRTSGAVPGWNQSVYFWFQQFKTPMVYTPGDNEWTDCHKTKEFKSGDPLKELAAVRSLFSLARARHWALMTETSCPKPYISIPHFQPTPNTSKT